MPKKKKTAEDNSTSTDIEVITPTVVKNTVGRLGTRNAIIENSTNIEDYADEDCTNSKLAAFSGAVLQIRKKANLQDIDTLYDCLEEYVALCGRVNMKLSNQMCYLACGVSKQLIDYWASGQKHKNDPRYMEFAKQCRALCGASREQLAMEGKINPVFAIWQQKVHDGYREDQVVMIAEEKEHNRTSAEIAKGYSDLD